MAETLVIPSLETDKKSRYEVLLPQLKALIEGEADLIANLGNIAAALKFGMNFFWVGFYLVKGNQLVLGPFQGPIACTRINMGKGVCGTSWKNAETIIVDDVDLYPGHIACSSESKSEIVLPVIKDGKVIMVMDVDSEKKAHFDKTDQYFLEQVNLLIESMV